MSQMPQITDPMWRMWTEGRAIMPGVRLGGIYANKSGYHNTRANNQRSWPGNYSIRVSLDLQGPSDKAAAIDYTLSTAEMRKRTGYLNAAAAANDPRLAAVREYYGTLNGSVVHGRIRDSRTGPWRSSSADSTHLWHIHISLFRAYVDSWSELAPVMSVLSGQSLASWRANPSLPGGGRRGGVMLPSKGDSGPVVEFWQRMLRRTGETFPKFGADAHWGAETTAAVQSSRRKLGWDPVAQPRITAAHAEQLFLKAYGGTTGGATDAQVRDAVETYLRANPPKDGQDGKTPTKVRLELTGDVIEAA